MQYVAGYVTKKMTSKDDPRLEGRHPEFARMSTRKGLGFSAMHEVASELMKLGLDDTETDVPSALRHGSSIMPLGRYLRRELRSLVGDPKEAPNATIQEAEARLSAMYEAAAAATPDGRGRKDFFKAFILEAGDQAVRQLEGRAAIRKERRNL